MKVQQRRAAGLESKFQTNKNLFLLRTENENVEKGAVEKSRGSSFGVFRRVLLFLNACESKQNEKTVGRLFLVVWKINEEEIVND